jgi:hypothetical protein
MWQCARQHAAVRAAVCGSVAMCGRAVVCGNAAVRHCGGSAAVRGSVRGSVWLRVRQCDVSVCVEQLNNHIR